MKEQDITFGEKYAIKRDGEVECWIVHEKVPPKQGATRSRTYTLRPPGATSWATVYTDASQILMPWTEYEQTPEYAKKNFELIRDHLGNKVMEAQREWFAMLDQYIVGTIQAVSTDTDSPPRMGMPASARAHATSADAFVASVITNTWVSVKLEALIRLAELPVPPALGVEQAIEHERETVAALRRALLPDIEKQVREVLSSPADRAGGFPYQLVSEYVDHVKALEIPGPHALLVDVARTLTNWHWLRSLAQSDSQFAYLLPYL